LNDYNLLTQLYPKYYPNRAATMMMDAPVVFGMRGTVRSYFKNGLLANPEYKDAMIDVGNILNNEIMATKLLVAAKTAGGHPELAGKPVNEALKDLEPITRVQL